MKRIGVVAAATAMLTMSGVALAGALAPVPVKTSQLDEGTPAAQGPWFSWNQNSAAHPDHYNVFVTGGPGSKIQVNADGTEAFGGGIDGETLVYYQHVGRFAGDVMRFSLRTHRRSRFPSKVNTRYDEYHPTISGPWLLFTRYVDVDQTTKVMLYNVRTGVLRVLDSDTGRHRAFYSGQVNGRYATYGHYTARGEDVFLYDISNRRTTKIPRTVAAQYNPSVTSDGTVFYTRGGDECGSSARLVRFPRGGPARVLFRFPAGVDAGYSYVDERSGGRLDVYYGKVNCRNSRWDIYKVVDSHTVTVSKGGTGSGTVTSSPSGISCGTDCHEIYHGGTEVTFTASEDAGSTFVGWSDPSCEPDPTNPSCTLTVEADVLLTATFDASPTA